MALLTSLMGISGTIIGAVVTSLVAETLKTYFKEPLKDKISEKDNYTHTYQYGTNSERRYGSYEQTPIKEKFQRRNYDNSYNYNTYNGNDDSLITAKILYIFPLVVILVIELIHFLGAIHIIPYDIFYSLESITNWKLLTTIGYALLIMGVFPFFSDKLENKIGIVLIIVGIIELIFGYADSFSRLYIIVSYLSSLREYVNIAIIIAILYTILTIPDEKNKQKTKYYY